MKAKQLAYGDRVARRGRTSVSSMDQGSCLFYCTLCFQCLELGLRQTRSSEHVYRIKTVLRLYSFKNQSPLYLATSSASAIIYKATHKLLLSGSQFPKMKTRGETVSRGFLPVRITALSYLYCHFKDAYPAIMPAPPHSATAPYSSGGS